MHYRKKQSKSVKHKIDIKVAQLQLALLAPVSNFKMLQQKVLH